VQQKFNSDCAVACMAMFLDVDYEDVVRHCAGYELVSCGLTNHRERYIAGLFEVEIVFRDRTKLDRSQAAVLTLPSLNSDKPSTHAVYWDGTRVHDPNHGRPGKRIYTNQSAWEVVIDGYQRVPV